MNRASLISMGILAVTLALATACGGGTAPTSEPTAAPTATTAPLATSPVITTAPEDTIAAAPTEPPEGGDTAPGQAVFLGKGCGACHTIEGVDGAVGAIGPNLTHVATNAATRKSGLGAEAYMRESIEDPPAFLVEGFGPLMPGTIRSTMTDAEFEDLVVFLLAQK